MERSRSYSNSVASTPICREELLLHRIGREAELLHGGVAKERNATGVAEEAYGYEGLVADAHGNLCSAALNHPLIGGLNGRFRVGFQFALREFIPKPRCRATIRS